MYYHNQTELWAEIKKCETAQFPLDIICLDPKWLENRYTKSCNFKYNENAFGNFKTLFTELKQKNIAVCFWINPYLQADDNYNWQTAYQNGYLVKTINSDAYAHPLTGTETYQTNCGIVDFTSSKATKWYQGELKKLFKLGLRFVKPDYGDGVPPNASFSNGLTGEQFRQYYAFLYCQAAYNASKEYFGPNETLVFCRPGYIGTQQFSGKWSGDSYSNFTELKIHLNAGLSLAMAGEMAWGIDIGGFYRAEPFNEDLYMRWTQLGMLLPLSRFHGIGPREPWNFSPAVLTNAIKYAKLKRKLLPYFKMCELEAITTGIPILRAMVLENEDDHIAELIDDQFYLGSNLLIAPILTPKTKQRQVYLPRGDWFLLGQKNKKFKGQRSYQFVCAIDEILIFVKANTVIPLIQNDSYCFDKLEQVTFELDVYGKLKPDYKVSFMLQQDLITITYKNNNFHISSNHKYIIK